MNIGVFLLGFIILVSAFVSDIMNYYDTYATLFIVFGFLLVFIGTTMPSASPSIEIRETATVAAAYPQKRTKIVLDEA